MAVSQRTEFLLLGRGAGYFHRVHRPLQCLIFITPLLVIYQVGAAARAAVFASLNPQMAYRVDVRAFVLLKKFFEVFGAAGNYLPLLSVVAILLAMHIAYRDKWEFDPQLYLGMALESVAWAIPVFVIGLAVYRNITPGAFATNLAAAPWQLDWATEAILSIGAGVYEELLFRLIGITLLNIIFMDVFELKISQALPLSIIISAAAFAAYHHPAEPFTVANFAFRVAAGVYLAAVYLFRGFGIAVGAHAMYDLIRIPFAHH